MIFVVSAKTAHALNNQESLTELISAVPLIVAFALNKQESWTADGCRGLELNDV